MTEELSRLDQDFLSVPGSPGTAPRRDPSFVHPTGQAATHPALLRLAALLGRQAAAEAFTATEAASTAD